MAPCKDFSAISRFNMRINGKSGIGVGGLVFLLLGLIFGCIGGGFAGVSLVALQDKLTCQGVVVGFHPKIMGNQHSLVRAKTVPEVEFTIDDKVYTIRGKIASTPPGYTVGESVPVYYQANQPEKGFVGSFLELWLFPIVFGGIGFVFTLTGCGFLLYARIGKV